MTDQPQPTQEQINERIRDKSWDEHASGLDGGDDEPEDE
jgi:hypothetical protein